MKFLYLHKQIYSLCYLNLFILNKLKKAFLFKFFISYLIKFHMPKFFLKYLISSKNILIIKISI